MYCNSEAMWYRMIRLSIVANNNREAVDAGVTLRNFAAPPSLRQSTAD